MCALLVELPLCVRATDRFYTQTHARDRLSHFQWLMSNVFSRLPSIYPITVIAFSFITAQRDNLLLRHLPQKVPCEQFTAPSRFSYFVSRARKLTFQSVFVSRICQSRRDTSLRPIKARKSYLGTAVSNCLKGGNLVAI